MPGDNINAADGSEPRKVFRGRLGVVREASAMPGDILADDATLVDELSGMFDGIEISGDDVFVGDEKARSFSALAGKPSAVFRDRMRSGSATPDSLENGSLSSRDRSLSSGEGFVLPDERIFRPISSSPLGRSVVSAACASGSSLSPLGEEDEGRAGEMDSPFARAEAEAAAVNAFLSHSGGACGNSRDKRKSNGEDYLRAGMPNDSLPSFELASARAEADAAAVNRFLASCRKTRESLNPKKHSVEESFSFDKLRRIDVEAFEGDAFADSFVAALGAKRAKEQGDMPPPAYVSPPSLSGAGPSVPSGRGGR